MVSRSQPEVCTARSPHILPEGVYPASLAQRRLWFLEQLQGPTSAYNVHTGLWLYGPLNLPALHSSLQTIGDRHETLRTSFSLVRDQLLQVVTPEFPVNIETADFSAETDPYPPALELAYSEVNRPFDLAQSPLMRILLMRMREEEHVVFCTMHHSITDATSMQLFAKEMALLYESFSKGSAADLPELSVQYGDYAEWQHEFLNSEQLQIQLSYWENKLKDSPKLLELPSDALRPMESAQPGATLAYAVPGEIMAAAKALAIRSNATLFTVLLAAFKVLLYRYSGEPDLLVGVPMSGRNQVETEPLIGFFVDTLVLRDDLSGNPSFQQVVAKVRETTLAAFANAEVPFDKVVERLQPERDLSYNPIFQVMFSLIKSAIRSHQFGDISVYPYIVSTNTAILDLFASFIEDSDGKWWLQFDFNSILFRKERIARMSEDFIALLKAVAADPKVHIDDVAIANAPRKTSVLKRGTNAAPKSSSNKGHSAPSDPQNSVSDARVVADELLLEEVWKEVLGLPRIGPRENFFDLGGHSLLAARLIRRIQDATGRKVPVSAIFRAPTLESFADLLLRETVLGPDPLLMKLRAGSSPIPFFAVAAPGVDSLGFGLLARNLKREQSMYKLQGPGPMIAGRPFEKEELQNLARAYIDAMRTVQPRGPYCFGGMCDGVQIAQQMVLELEAAGEEVALFVIFDTWVLENTQVRVLWALDYYLQKMKALRHLPSEQRFRIVRKALRRRSQSITGFSQGQSNGQGNGNARAWQKAYWPGQDFQQPQFHAPILLFKRPKQPYLYVRDRQMGWGSRSRGGVEICEIDCRHYEMLRPPYVRLTAARLHAQLDEINSKVNSKRVA